LSAISGEYKAEKPKESKEFEERRQEPESKSQEITRLSRRLEGAALASRLTALPGPERMLSEDEDASCQHHRSHPKTG